MYFLSCNVLISTIGKKEMIEIKDIDWLLALGSPLIVGRIRDEWESCLWESYITPSTYFEAITYRGRQQHL